MFVRNFVRSSFVCEILEKMNTKTGLEFETQNLIKQYFHANFPKSSQRFNLNLHFTPFIVYKKQTFTFHLCFFRFLSVAAIFYITKTSNHWHLIAMFLLILLKTSSKYWHINAVNQNLYSCF